MNRLARSLVPAGLLLMMLAGATASEPSPPIGVTDLARYLETFALDHEAREILDAGPPWTDDQTSLVVRVLLRIMLAPPEFTAAWREAARPIAALPTPPGDCFAHAVGRAVFVAELRLPEELGALTGRRSVDLVRLRTDRSGDIDVVTDVAPRAWPRGRDIDEPAEVFGLPVAARNGPAPASASGAAKIWPAEPPALLLAAARVAWHPPRLPGSAGMDVGLLDGVIDGQKLTAADADAFYALLAAAGKAGKGTVAAAAGRAASLLPVIDPAERWFEQHRGEPLAIEGVALRATRIEIDDPLRRRQTGIDHYWEMFVFVNTPLISVGGKAQDRYPVVCCLRELPAGMPSGPVISEPVRVAGFALKSYAYPLRTGDGSEVRREAPLLVGGDVSWQRSGEESRAGPLPSIFVALAILVVMGVAVAAWAGQRDARKRQERRRASLPDRFEPPQEELPVESP